jgi:hypothetical protein
VATLKSSGVVSVKLTLRGVNYSGRGKFDADGNTEIVLRSGKPTVTIKVQVDLTSPTYPLTGQVTSLAGVDAIPETISVKNLKNRLPAGLSYTVAMHMPAGEPSAHGFAAVKLSRTSSARIVGQLADGTPFSVSAAQRRDGTVSWAVRLYHRAGWALGTWMLTETPETPLGGFTSWVRTGAAQGFERVLPTEVSRYRAPSVATVSSFDFPDTTSRQARMSLRDGGLAPLELSLSLSRADAVPSVAGEPLELKVNRASGVFVGTLRLDDTSRPIHGAILQDQNKGFGYFLNGSESGAVELVPR